MRNSWQQKILHDKVCPGLRVVTQCEVTGPRTSNVKVLLCQLLCLLDTLKLHHRVIFSLEVALVGMLHFLQEAV